MPFMELWVEIESAYTGGDGYLDKLCVELVGLPSSRNRPPTRDVRERYREQTRRMLIDVGRAERRRGRGAGRLRRRIGLTLHRRGRRRTDVDGPGRRGHCAVRVVRLSASTAGRIRPTSRAPSGWRWRQPLRAS